MCGWNMNSNYPKCPNCGARQKGSHYDKMVTNGETMNVVCRNCKKKFTVKAVV